MEIEMLEEWNNGKMEKKRKVAGYKFKRLKEKGEG